MPDEQPLSPLFDEFSALSTEEWEATIHQDLKGRSYDDVLVWDSLEGVTLQPYYRRDDLQDIAHIDAQASVPPLAGGGDLPANGWDVRQDVSHPDLNEALRLAGRALDRGVDALGFRATVDGDGVSGLPLQSLDEAETFLDGLPSPLPPLHLSRGPEAAVLYAMITTICPSATERLRGTVEFDPTGALAGGSLTNAETAFDLAADLIRSREDAPHMRTWAVSASPYHDAGASIVQEVTGCLGALSEALDQFTKRGIDLQDAVDALHLTVPVSTGYFVEMAKLRAIRLLVPQVVGAFANEMDAAVDLQPSDVFLQCFTSRRSQSRYDPYVNMLRTTTEAMAAVFGGCDVLRVDRYDARLRSPQNFSQRIARNSQLILREESRADHVADPAAGSYYIEAATDQIARRAWSAFQDLEQSGGALEALRAGTFQDDIATVREKREDRVAHRDRVLVGTNHYPDLSETQAPSSASPGGEASATNVAAGDSSPRRRPLARRTTSDTAWSGSTLTDLRRHLGDGATLADLVDLLRGRETSETEPNPIEPLPVVRLSDPFDALRQRTEHHAAETGSPPTVFLAPLGNPSMRSARSKFARNFFGVAGFDITDNLRFKDPAEAVQAAVEENADVIVLCSSDAEYPDLGRAFRSALSDVDRDPLLVIAGNADQMDADVDADGFVHLGSPLLETLRTYQDRLFED